MDGQHQKKQFNYPKREDIIQEIKALDDAIQNVSLNLIKCHFDATQKDIEKSFPEYKFIKVKNYNPGSFEVVFQMKIDAINFVKTCYDRKILNRRFFIKMGRQHKEIVENWTCIGQMPNKFNHHKKGKFDKKGQFNKDHKDQKDQKEHKQHKEPRQPRQPREPREPKEHRQPRHQKKTFQKPAPVEKKEQTAVKTQQKNVQKVQTKPQIKKQAQNVPKVEAKKQPVKTVEEKPKHEEKKHEKPKHEQKKQKPVAQEAKKQVKPVQTKQQAPKATQQTKAEDDGWIKVAPKGKKR